MILLETRNQKPETAGKYILFLLILMLILPAGCSSPVPTDLSPIKILYTGDIDGYIDPCG